MGCLPSPESQTPSRPRAARVPTSASKKLSAAQILKEKKSIVKDIKKRITPLKFHNYFDVIDREVKFAAERLPLEAAESLLGIAHDSWTSATVTVTLSGNEAIHDALDI